MSNPIDLCTLEEVKEWLNLPDAATNSDALIARLITNASMFFMQRTGLLPPGGGIPAVSPFTSVCPFNEWYDGSGTYRQFVRNRPIVEVTQLSIQGTNVAASTGPNNPGYCVDDGGMSISLIGGRFAGSSWNPAGGFSGGGFASGLMFAPGVHNVNVQYTAGYAATPYDVAEACVELVGYTARKRNWIGQASQALAAGGGTVSYVKFDITPAVEAVIQSYTRKALV